MAKPIIGIIGRADCSDTYSTISVLEAYRRAIIMSGGNPILILPPQNIDYYDFAPKNVDHLTIGEEEMIIDQIKLCDGILMPGGNKRYEYDHFITNYCLNKNIPILGICLGMQLLAMHIKQNTLVAILDNSHKLKSDEAHHVTLDPNSKLCQIIGTTQLDVNSSHSFKVSDVGDFSVVGLASDGTIEAIERKDKTFAIGVQWHPERLMDHIENRRLFNYFIEVCQNESSN